MESKFAQLDLYALEESEVSIFKIFPPEANYGDLRTYIELSGGIVLDCSEDDPYAVSIVDLDWYLNVKKISLPPTLPADHFLSSFIYDCYEHERVFDLNLYKVENTDSDYVEYDANQILQRRLPWSAVPKRHRHRHNILNSPSSSPGLEETLLIDVTDVTLQPQSQSRESDIEKSEVSERVDDKDISMNTSTETPTPILASSENELVDAEQESESENPKKFFIKNGTFSFKDAELSKDVDIDVDNLLNISLPTANAISGVSVDIQDNEELILRNSLGCGVNSSVPNSSFDHEFGQADTDTEVEPEIEAVEETGANEIEKDKPIGTKSCGKIVTGFKEKVPTPKKFSFNLFAPKVPYTLPKVCTLKSKEEILDSSAPASTSTPLKQRSIKNAHLQQKVKSCNGNEGNDDLLKPVNGKHRNQRPKVSRVSQTQRIPTGKKSSKTSSSANSVENVHQTSTVIESLTHEANMGSSNDHFQIEITTTASSKSSNYLQFPSPERTSKRINYHVENIPDSAVRKGSLTHQKTLRQKNKFKKNKRKINQEDQTCKISDSFVLLTPSTKQSRESSEAFTTAALQTELSTTKVKGTGIEFGTTASKKKKKKRKKIANDEFVSNTNETVFTISKENPDSDQVLEVEVEDVQAQKLKKRKKKKRNKHKLQKESEESRLEPEPEQVPTTVETISEDTEDPLTEIVESKRKKKHLVKSDKIHCSSCTFSTRKQSTFQRHRLEVHFSADHAASHPVPVDPADHLNINFNLDNDLLQSKIKTDTCDASSPYPSSKKKMKISTSKSTLNEIESEPDHSRKIKRIKIDRVDYLKNEDKVSKPKLYESSYCGQRSSNNIAFKTYQCKWSGCRFQSETAYELRLHSRDHDGSNED